jgi:hypothetical protein
VICGHLRGAMKKLTKRQRRTAKNMVLPLVAVMMMATMFMMEASSRSSHGSSAPSATLKAAPGAAARLAPDQHRR